MAITDLIPWRRKEPVRREEGRPSAGESYTLTSFHREMNRLFDEFYRAFDLAPFGGLGEGWDVYSPRVDVTETDKEIVVSAELPGLDSKDIDISLSQDVLTISGQKRQEKEEKGKNYYRAERSYGSFRRSIPLPSEVEADKVDAAFERGVLTVTLPKSAEARAAKKITVKSR